MFNQWKDIYNVVKDNANGDSIQNRKADVWISLDKVFAFMEKKEWSNNSLESFGNILETWKNAFIIG